MKCEKCGQGNMIIKLGQYGLFGACNRFPSCRNTIKLNKILYAILKQDGINIYGWEHECWKCHKKTKVYTYFINKQIKPYMDKYVELDNLGLDSVSPIDEYLKKNYKTINRNFSKTQNKYCTSNNCVFCNALIGNYFIVEDPHDIFDDWIVGDLNKYIVEKIPFHILNVTESDFTGLEDCFVQIC